MRNLKVNPVNNTPDLLGLLFFSQCLDELLFDHTDDSYKAPALNLVSRAIELRMIAGHALRTGISQESLKPFIEELDWGISIDPVLLTYEKQRFQHGLKRVTTSGISAKKIIPYLEWLTDSISDYFGRLKNKISTTIIEPHKKKELRALATAFAAHVEIEGYSRRFAYQHTQRVLIKALRKDIKTNPDAIIAKFLDRFSGAREKSKIHFRGDSAFSDYADLAINWGISISPTKPEISQKHKKLDEFFTDNNYSFITINEVEERDPYSARDRAEQFLNMFVSAIKYHDHKINLDFDELCIVETISENRTWYTTVGSKPNPVLCRNTVNGIFDSEGLSKTSKVIGGHHLTSSSTIKFNNALNYHRASLKAPILQNQLVSLWAALEGLLPNPDASEVRIKFFVDVVSSILTLAYTKKLLKVISKQLQDENTDISQIIENIPGANITEKTALFICSINLDHLRLEVAAKLDDNPLLRFRIKELNDNLSSVRAIYKFLCSHKKKIEWHLNRIYWTRNLIVHSAESMPYLFTVVENLHDYLDLVMDAITFVANNRTSQTSIDSIVNALQTDFEIRLEKLQEQTRKQDVQCDNNNTLSLIFGDNNPFFSIT